MCSFKQCCLPVHFLADVSVVFQGCIFLRTRVMLLGQLSSGGNTLAKSSNLLFESTTLSMKNQLLTHPNKMGQLSGHGGHSLLCLLIDVELPKQLCTYAVMTSAHIRNRCFNPRTS